MRILLGLIKQNGTLNCSYTSKGTSLDHKITKTVISRFLKKDRKKAAAKAQYPLFAGIASLLLLFPAAASAFDTIVVFNEIHYHPAGDVLPNLEFVELYNQNTADVDMSGWRISSGIDFTFPDDTILGGREYLVVAANPSALETATGGTGILGPFTGLLDNGGERLRLRNGNDRIMDEVTYDDRAPWPIGADGSGATLAKMDPDGGSSTSNWRSSFEVNGTPGAANFNGSTSFPLTINELAGSTAPTGNFFIELYNSGTTELALDGFVLRSESGDEFVIQGGVTISAEAVISFSETELGFRQVNGDNLYLYTALVDVLIDAMRADDTGRARYPDGTATLYVTGNSIPATAGAFNAAPLESDIVINEIMYHHRPNYATEGDPAVVTSSTLLNWNASWRYNESGENLGSLWALSAHTTGGNWESGTGPLGYETSSDIPPQPISTTLTQPSLNSPYVLTYYFETEFSIAAATLATTTEVTINHEVDDGAIFYINGVEVGRYDMPEGDVTSSTLAENSSSEADAIRQLTVQKEYLTEGTNRISVEIHQVSGNSSDVIMGVNILADQVIASSNPATAFSENDEEWIELYNKGTSDQDISGWELDGAVSFTAPTGTVISANQYLIIAENTNDFGAKFPRAVCIGQYSGSLSNSGEDLLLLDTEGNPADEVAYLDGAPWPGAADGEGSSMELRNPRIDNSAPEAWTASSNEDNSEWADYSFTIQAQSPVYSPSIYSFHELRLGLLDSGVILLDDVSVIEDPGGANTELIANGSFDDATGWRLLGTHEQSSVVNDGGENVLKVVASNRMTYLNNLMECNLTRYGWLRSVQAGTNYKISFRAKWLSGSPQFRFEFYYNKLARTVILNQPEKHGTPGAQNSGFESVTGPTYKGLTHSPAVPTPGERIIVSTAAADPDGVSSLTLHYAVNGGSFSSSTMTYLASESTWQGSIPGQAEGAVVQFYIEGKDNNQTGSYAPADGPDSRAMIKWTAATTAAGKQSLRLIMLASEASTMHHPYEICSNRRFGCTIITDEEDIAYDCGIRLRGSMWSRRVESNSGLNLKFPADKPYRGVHSTITTRKRDMREIVAKHIINQAGGLHDNYNDVIYQYGHISDQNGWTRLEMARFGANYLEGLPEGDGKDGTIFKMEGIRVPTETEDGTSDTPKLLDPDVTTLSFVNSFDLDNQGDNKEMYRHNLPINNNQDKDDYSRLIAMCQTLELSGTTLENAIEDVIDVDMWTRQFAMLSLCGVTDIYTQGQPHNLNMYVRPADQIIEPMPWDWDHPFLQSTTASLWGSGDITKVFARPKFSRLFYGHMYDIINTTFNSTYMSYWTSHYGSLTGENYSSYITYINNRSDYVLTQLPTEIEFAITTNDGIDFSVATSVVTLEGDGWINVREIYVDSNREPTPITWTDDDSWSITIPITPGLNEITLRAIDHQRTEVGRDTIKITNSGDVEPASSSNLVISEIHYHPASGLAEEFIELQNILTNAAVDLTGVAFVSGISFSFTAGTQIAAGERLLLVQDATAFAAKYGALPFAGIFAAESRLANSGERLRLEATGGVAIRDFSYNDKSPWPESADGQGPSLVLMAPSTNPDHAIADNWRSSTAISGNPGTSDATTYTGDDLLDYAMNGEGLTLTLSTNGIPTTLEFPFNLAADDVAYTVESSTNLVNWIIDPTINTRTAIYDLTEGFFNVEHTVPLDPPSPFFLRLRLELLQPAQ